MTGDVSASKVRRAPPPFLCGVPPGFKQKRNQDRDGVGYLILICIDFIILCLRFLLGIGSIEKTFRTLTTVFNQISKHLKVRQKYSFTRRIFNSILGVSKCGQTRFVVFEILLHLPLMQDTTLTQHISTFDTVHKFYMLKFNLKQ